MTESEQIVASLIDNNRISGIQAIALLRAIYGRERKDDKILTPITNKTWTTEVLCASQNVLDSQPLYCDKNGLNTITSNVSEICITGS